MPQSKTAAQALMFANRLEKQYKHLRKWAKRTGTTCYRLYDKDIPEVPLAVDIFHEMGTESRFLHIALYERPYDKPEEEEEIWMAEMQKAAAEILSIPESNCYSKLRRKQRGEESQYERKSNKGRRIIIDEGGSRFLLNLSDYLDTGLFLDHRPARLMVRSEAKNRRVLNLFCYTGSFSVHAAAGGAESVTSVDLSKTYLSWAAENLNLNGFPSIAPEAGPKKNTSADEKYACVHSDVKSFLTAARRTGDKWDLIICDPPTFSNSKRTVDILDLNRDWAELCRLCLALLSPGGILYFSTNSRSLKFDRDDIGGAASRDDIIVTDLSLESIPEDFRNKKIHRLWKFVC